MRNLDFAHECFYTDKEKFSNKGMSKVGNKLYSYLTCVGWFSKKFRVTFLTESIISRSSSRHVALYSYGSPYKTFMFDLINDDIVFDKARSKKELYSQVANTVIKSIEKKINQRKKEIKNKENKKRILFNADEKRSFLFVLANLRFLSTHLECKNSIKNQKKIDKFENEIFLVDTNGIEQTPFHKKDDNTRFKLAVQAIKKSFKYESKRLNIDFNLIWNEDLKNLIYNFKFSEIIDKYVNIRNSVYNEPSSSVPKYILHYILTRSERISAKFINSILKLICAKDSRFHNTSVYSYSSPAFLICLNKMVLTSKGILLEEDVVVERFLSLWLNPNFNRKRAVGHKVGPYEIYSVKDDHVRIGCHLFPTFILDDFAEFLLNKRTKQN